MKVQQNGKKVVLASGRPINGVAPLAEELYLKEYGGFMLSFNGARITRCSDNAIIYNKVIPQEVIRPIYEAVKEYPGLDLISYTDKVILSGIKSNEYTEKEAAINSMEICPVEDFPAALDFPVNKMLIPGEPSILEDLMPKLQKQYHGLLNIYRSEPFFLEIMPQNIDKAHSLQKLLNSIGLTADSMICCGDGFNDLSMIEYAGLGVAMKVNMIVVMLLIGLGTGIQPLLGYCFGAGNRKRYFAVLKFSILLAFVLSAIMTCVCYFGADGLVSAFLEDADAYDFGFQFSRIYILSGPILGQLFVFINAIQSTGAALPSLILSISRQGLLYLPILFIINATTDSARLLALAQPVTDYLATALAIILFVITCKKYFPKKSSIE